jgi:hypothetical protein
MTVLTLLIVTKYQVKSLGYFYLLYSWLGMVTAVLSPAASMMFICCVVNAIRVRFKLINEGLRLKKDVVILTSMHVHLCEIVASINTVFTLTIVLYMMTNLVGMTISSFQVYIFCTAQRFDPKNIVSLLLTSIWSVYMCSTIFIAVVWCSVTTGEGRRCEEVVHGVVNHEEYEFRRLRLLMLQMRHAAAVFSCGLLEIDLEVVAMVSIERNCFVRLLFSAFSIF